MFKLKTVIFFADVFLLCILLLGIVWSVIKPDRRIWPPPGRTTWQYRVTWICFYLIFSMNAAIFFLDWNSWIFHHVYRFIIGVPITLIGGLLVAWGIIALGSTNTSGIPDGFVASGPYAFTRNPQYLGDNIMFVGLSIIANSLLLWIVHVLLILVFTISPLAEEPWLKSQYGQKYVDYKQSTPRFL